MQLFIFLLVCSSFSSLVFGADPPAFIQWPASWHANVFVADATLFQSIKAFIPITGSGSYYYDSTSSSAVFTLLSPTTGRNIREVIGNESVDIIDGPTLACTPKSPRSSSRYQLLPPDFLSQGKFSFVAVEYYLRNEVWYETYHWTGRYPTLSLTTIDYWHTVETNAPYRLSWGALDDPIVLEFSNVMAGLDDIPNVSYLFGTPSSCTNGTGSVLEKEEKKEPSKQRVSASSGNAWPLQWHANSYYTGNNFGLQTVIGEPTTVPISLIGQYYYDWQNLRECNVWTDAVSGVRTKTLITNGTFYLVTMATNSCLIVPTGPVNGPLKNEWPTGLTYVDDELVLPPLNPQPASYAWTQHFYFDAFNIGPEHSFHYWQTSDTQVPLQFQGPVLEFPPYGQSMMSWSQFEQGLSGVDLEDIFSLPPVCKKIIPEQKDLALSPLIQLQIALNKMHK